MDPVTTALIAGTVMQGVGSLFGGLGANKAAKRQEEEQRRRLAQLQAALGPLLGEAKGAGAGEQWLLNLLGGAPGEAWNTGQDALMQMLREDTYDPTALFSSWEPTEQRALDESLAGMFAGAPGLGQRFGTATRREEGRVRGQAAEGAATRRQQAQMGLYEAGQGRKLSASETLLQSLLQNQGQRIGAAQAAGGFGQQRQNFMAQLLGMMYGQPVQTAGASAVPGAIGDIGQLIAFLPLLMSLMKPQAAPTT